MIAKDPQDHFPGYPDVNSDFYKLDLFSEGKPIVPIEATGASASLMHGYVAVSSDNKLALTYQAPTGTSYGFKGAYKRYDGNNNLSVNENVFTNANWGSWMRNIETVPTPTENITTRLVSFSHAGYYPMIHKRDEAGAWTNYYLQGPNVYVGSLSAIKDNITNEVHISGRWGYGSQTPVLRYYKLNSALNSFSPLDFAIPIQNSCDIKMNNANYPGMLVVHNDKLKLLTQTGASTWALDSSLVYQKGIDHRASLFFRTNGTPVVAYQTVDKVAVIQRNASTGVWDVLFAHNNLIPTEFVGSTKGPTLLMYCNDLHIVYNDGKNVYKMNIDRACNAVGTIPCDLVLPLDVLAFTAKQAPAIDLERSTDGVNFKTIESFNSPKKFDYTYDDAAVEPQVLYYYRLKMVENNTPQYSRIQSARIEGNMKIKVYPNPTSGDITISYESDKGGNVHIKIVNLLGQLVVDKQVTVEKVQTFIPINLQEMTNGIYNIIIDSNGQIVKEKVIIAK
jgi:Secretion system C-terminal sorting domain